MILHVDWYRAQEAALAKERDEIFSRGKASHEQVLDNIVKADELTALGWTQDPDTYEWMSPPKGFY
jgi:hypothetical protein